MAAKHFYRQGFLLLLFNFISTAALEKRFSDLKRCADEECSMLLVRGKAMVDFSGPDCRFLTVKKSETVYVYYKLSGRRADLWAGSVGSNFGYFPMDLLAVNHIYTDKEVEVPAEETDFVCFDTGFDKFDNYDVDLLLGSLSEDKEGTSDETEEENDQHEKSEELHKEVPDDQSASSHDPEMTSESYAEEEERDRDTLEIPERDHTEVPETSETKNTATETAVDLASKEELVSEHGLDPERSETTDGTTYDAVISDYETTMRYTPNNDEEENKDLKRGSEGMDRPELKTVLGSTFDAVVSEAEITNKVSPDEEEEGEHDEILPEDDADRRSETPLLSFVEEMKNTQTGDFPKVTEGAQMPDLKTTLGSTFDAVVSQGQITNKVSPYEEEEESQNEEKPLEDAADLRAETPLLSFSGKAKNTPEDDLKKVTEGVQVPDSKTTLGSTFDAVVSEGEISRRVSPYDEEEVSENEEVPPQADVKEDTLLLSYSEKAENTPESGSPKITEGVEVQKLKTTLGSTYDAVVSGGEITRKVSPDVEEQGETVEHPSAEDVDAGKGTPLLSFKKETPGSHSDATSEGAQTPHLKTTPGSTFDAVVSDDEITKKVTPYEEEEGEEMDSPLEAFDNNVKEDTPLLSFTGNKEVTPPRSDRVSEEKQIPELKTSQGTTFDAVVSNDEITRKTTAEGEEEETEYVEHPSEDQIEGEKGTPLLSSSEKSQNTPPSDSLKEEKNMWTSFGDAVFNVVTGGERTAHDFDSEEDDDDDDDDDKEEAVRETPEVFHRRTRDVEEPPSAESLSKQKAAGEIRDHPSTRAVQSDKHSDDGDDRGVVGPGGALKPTDDAIQQQEEPSMKQDDDKPAIPKAKNKDIKTTGEPLEPEVSHDDADHHNDVTTEHELEKDLAKKNMDADQVLSSSKTEKDQKPPIEDIQPEQSDAKENRKTLHDRLHQKQKHLISDLESNTTQAEFWPYLQPDIQEESHTEVLEGEHDTEKEELLEDENALSSPQPDAAHSDDPLPDDDDPTVSAPEPEYSDSILRLTLIRDHFTEEKMERIQALLGLKNLFKVEAMFSDLDAEMKATRLLQTTATQDVESALEGILETSENTILDEIERMLDSRDAAYDHDQHTESLDEETEILDDFQELAFSLRQKYSTASDSTPLAAETTSDHIQASETKPEVPPAEVDVASSTPVAESEDNFTVTDQDKRPAETTGERGFWEERHSGPDVNMQEDGGHFNRNKDNQPSFSASEEMQKVPQDTLDSPRDMGLGVEVDHSSSGSSGSLDSMDPGSEIHVEEVGLLSTGLFYSGCILSMMKTKVTEWTVEMISLLPEEWKPGETLYGVPWQAVLISALVGVVTFTLFFWRTVLAVKKKQYLVDEKKLSEQIHALKKEREDALKKMSELQKQTEHLKENEKQSKEEVSYTVKKLQDLESKVLEAEKQNKQIAEEKNKYIQLLQEETAHSQQNESRIEKLEKSKEKLQLSRKKIQDALAKTTSLLDEAKIREDARNVNQKSLQKDCTALKEENKTLKATIKSWEEKHKELNEQIKVYQKSQKELEDSVVLKDHNVEVLSDLLSDLEACDSQKGDAKALANGEAAPEKKTAIKNRIKQMMDVSRVQTTLSVVEEERDRFMTKLLNEEKSRKSLEEQHQELEHAIATLKSEKGHVENQFKILQQKNEIMVEMYQQKENALQQRLTKEELERRSKESMLSEVGGKATEAEEQVKVLRQRINEMEEQMKKTEEVYKEQIKEQENKTHSNWVNARNAERALNQEKLESSKLREKLVVLTSQLNERRAPLFRPNSGQPSGPRQGDSYGPSPVSGGAPSPPIMIEGPRRPPSAPVGRRIDPYGPRPPSDPHGRYAENKHISGMDMMGPRSSSPANMDTSTQAVDPQIDAETKAEASTDSPEPGPGSFLASPIRDSPGPAVQGPPPGPGPHDQIPPPGPHGRLPPPGPYRPPRPNPYHLPPGPHGPLPPNVPPPLHGPPLPANGHPGMPLPGPMGGDFGPRPTNGHTFLPRPGPGPVMDPRGPLPPHFRPPPPHHFGPMPPPHGLRGPMGPRPPMPPPDMRFPGPRDHTSPPMNLPPGVPPHFGDAYGQAPPDALQNSMGAHSGPAQGPNVKQEAPQDSGRPAMVKP